MFYTAAILFEVKIIFSLSQDFGVTFNILLVFQSCSMVKLQEEPVSVLREFGAYSQASKSMCGITALRSPRTRPSLMPGMSTLYFQQTELKKNLHVVKELASHCLAKITFTFHFSILNIVEYFLKNLTMFKIDK